MNEYICILQFCGENYVSQIQGPNENEVMWKWASLLNVSIMVKGIRSKGKQEILWLMEIETPTPIDDMINVWLFGIRPRSGFGTVHVFKMSNRAIPEDQSVIDQQTLFTCIFEFQGGVYISQVEDVSVRHAAVKWATHLEVDSIQYLGEILKQQIVNEVRNVKIYAFENAENAWHFIVHPNRRTAIVKIVATASK